MDTYICILKIVVFLDASLKIEGIVKWRGLESQGPLYMHVDVSELLPGIDNFLGDVLAKENLSSFAERQRQFYLERLEILKFNPPSLPPRPDSKWLVKTGNVLAGVTLQIHVL